MGPKEEYQQYLKSTRWKELSERVKREAEYRCKLCDAGVELHVHHRAYYRVETDKEILDLVCLCKKCHEKHHGVIQDDEPREVVDFGPEVATFLVCIYIDKTKNREKDKQKLSKVHGLMSSYIGNDKFDIYIRDVQTQKVFLQSTNTTHFGVDLNAKLSELVGVENYTVFQAPHPAP